MRRKMIWLATGIFILLGYFTWKYSARSAYESPTYQVTLQDGQLEVREYPSLVLASTQTTGFDGNDGSFMKLFNYISGQNSDERKLSMTVPVFMQDDPDANSRQMSFVVPRDDVKQGVPSPTGDTVRISQRTAGRFAVVRFSGRVTDDLVSAQEAQLRAWMKRQGLVAADGCEVAGYDPPWVPGPLRRNEVLIRVTDSD